MRLLSQKEISEKKSAEMSREVSEGMKVAKKIDALRETWANEESKWNEFKEKSLSQISSEISKATKERDDILSEVCRLREEISKGTSELDARSSRLDRESDRLETRMEAVAFMEDKISRDKSEADRLLQIAKNKLLTAETREKESERLQSDALELRNKADCALTEATQEVDKAIKLKNDTEIAAEQRLSTILYREKELKAWEERNQQREQELSTAILQVNDQRATLEREIQRRNLKL